MLEFSAWVASIQNRTEAALQARMPATGIIPSRLHEAMRYSVLGGGKRVRALLAHAAGEFCRANSETLDRAAMAVELIHAYSLVHDDMPCMDNDDLRRGKPSCHKKFDDATALLVGDALQSLAFELLSDANFTLNPTTRIQMIHTLAHASGSLGMAGGQAIDLASVGLSISQSELEQMHLYKTGALIRAAAMLGGYCGQFANHERLAAIDYYAQHIGLAFQVVDDILDTEADTQTLGKTAGKDKQNNKPTYVTILGLAQAKQLALALYNRALEPLADFGDEAIRLHQLAAYITQRNF